MSRFMCQKYSGLEAYKPGEQPTDMKYVKLNTNESPYPPSSGVIAAVDALRVSELNLYPDPLCGRLKEKLAQTYGVDAGNIFVSNGSDDILNFFFMAFCENGSRGVVFPDISYGFYKVYAGLYRTEYRQIPLLDDFSLNADDYCGIGKNIVIANPNAPTGIAISTDKIEKIVSSNPDNIVLIDEAYVDFGAESCVKLTKKYKNLIVVQTFSKSRSMAGARLGFAVADSEIISDLEKIKFSTNPYNINRLTLAAGEAALCDNIYYKSNCKEIEKNREYTSACLKRLGFTLTDSKANFIFAASDEISGCELYRRLKKSGVLIRHFDVERIRNYNRITIGTRGQMDLLIAETDRILKEIREKR